MPDMLVNLTALPDLAPIIAEQKAKGVRIRRGQPEESYKIAEWVRENVNPNWAMGCEVALDEQPTTCFIALETGAASSPPADNPNDLQPERILGFACYDVVTKGVFGPTGVREDYQDSRIDTALLLTCLHEMADLNYEQATIGWTAFIDRTSKTDFDDNQQK